MNNYIILNGNISTNIPGLLIQSLPSITKPKIRTQIEEIDGRDGDIVTTLGYSAYDKELTIGLYGDFDINQVIAYFNSNGIVVFSNEPDKYYNYQILDQIDFERLIRYRTATVKMHVQPFKYSAEDNEKTITPKNLLNALDIDYGEASGNGGSTSTYLTLTKSVGQIEITINQDYSAGLFAGKITISNLTIGQWYVLSGVADTNFNNVYIYTDRLWGTRVTSGNINNGVKFQATTTSVVIGFYTTNNTVGTTRTISNIQFEKGQNPTSYVPYNTIYIRNAGNYFSKPSITIYGTGSIELTLNGLGVFSISMGTYTSITIDAAQMEAYNGSTLLNRQVTGDYNNFKLNVGSNTISWTGSITQIQLENYSRWI